MSSKRKILPTTWQRWLGKTVIVLDNTKKPTVGHVSGFNNYGWIMIQALNDGSTHFSTPLNIIEYSYGVYRSLNRIYTHQNNIERLKYSSSQLRTKVLICV